MHIPGGGRCPIFPPHFVDRTKSYSGLPAEDELDTDLARSRCSACTPTKAGNTVRYQLCCRLRYRHSDYTVN